MDDKNYAPNEGQLIEAISAILEAADADLRRKIFERIEQYRPLPV